MFMARKKIRRVTGWVLVIAVCIVAAVMLASLAAAYKVGNEEEAVGVARMRAGASKV